eukprot:3169859-Amphidinium_carterae.1
MSDMFCLGCVSKWKVLRLLPLSFLFRLNPTTQLSHFGSSQAGLQMLICAVRRAARSCTRHAPSSEHDAS